MRNFRSRFVNSLPIRVRRVSREAKCRDLHTDPHFPAKKTIVELTLPKDANIHAREYQLYLPSKELLKQKLDEWSAAVTG